MSANNNLLLQKPKVPKKDTKEYTYREIKAKNKEEAEMLETFS